MRKQSARWLRAVWDWKGQHMGSLMARHAVTPGSRFDIMNSPMRAPALLFFRYVAVATLQGKD